MQDEEERAAIFDPTKAWQSCVDMEQLMFMHKKPTYADIETEVQSIVKEVALRSKTSALHVHAILANAYDEVVLIMCREQTLGIGGLALRAKAIKHANRNAVKFVIRDHTFLEILYVLGALVKPKPKKFGQLRVFGGVGTTRAGRIRAGNSGEAGEGQAGVPRQDRVCALAQDNEDQPTEELSQSSRDYRSEGAAP